MANDDFKKTGFTLIHNPTICILEPAPTATFPDLNTRLSQEAEDAVNTWKNALQMQSSAKAWNMSSVIIPYDKPSAVNSLKCDITISFKPYSSPNAITLLPVGQTSYDFFNHSAKIVVNYLAIVTEQHTKSVLNRVYYWSVPVRYDLEHLADKTIIDAELMRELGHAFGLGDYIPKGDEIPPITNVDAVKSLYGVNGFNSPIISQPNNTPQSIHSTTTITIPATVKSNAKDWSNGNADNNQFVKVLRWLSFENALKLPETTAGSDWQTIIPNWIKKDTRLWINGDMTDNDFFTMLQYLIDNKKITLNPYD